MPLTFLECRGAEAILNLLELVHPGLDISTGELNNMILNAPEGLVEVVRTSTAKLCNVLDTWKNTHGFP